MPTILALIWIWLALGGASGYMNIPYTNTEILYKKIDTDAPLVYHPLQTFTTLKNQFRWRFPTQKLGSGPLWNFGHAEEKNEASVTDEFTAKALEHGTLSAAQAKAISHAAKSDLEIRCYLKKNLNADCHSFCSNISFVINRKAFAESRKSLLGVATGKPIRVRPVPDLAAAAAAAHAASERARASVADARAKVAAASAAAAKLAALDRDSRYLPIIASDGSPAAPKASSAVGVALPL